MSEEIIITHCSPTLAGMKTGSMFSCTFVCEHKLKSQIDECNYKLNPNYIASSNRKKCTNVYCQKFLKGLPILRLTITA